jgi:hypothetical protein
LILPSIVALKYPQVPRFFLGILPPTVNSGKALNHAAPDQFQVLVVLALSRRWILKGGQ